MIDRQLRLTQMQIEKKNKAITNKYIMFAQRKYHIKRDQSFWKSFPLEKHQYSVEEFFLACINMIK